MTSPSDPLRPPANAIQSPVTVVLQCPDGGARRDERVALWAALAALASQVLELIAPFLR